MATVPVKADLDFTSGKAINLPAPSAGGDAANKTYVDGKVIRERFTIGGNLVVGTGKGRLYFTQASTILNIHAGIDTAPTGASAIFDVNKNGTTIFTTQGNRPTIAISANVDATSTPDVTAMAAGDYLTVDCDQRGSTVLGADATITVEYTVP